MNKIEVKTQEKFDKIPDNYNGDIIITGYVSKINKSFPNAIVSVSDSGSVGSVSDSGSVGSVYGNGSVDSVYGNGSVVSVSDSGSVDSVYGNGRVGSVSDSGSVGSVSGNGRVVYVSGNGSVVSVSDSGSVDSVSDSGSVGSVSDSGSVGSVYGNGRVVYVSDSGSVGSVYGNGRVVSVSGNGRVVSVSDSGSVGSVYGNAIVRLNSANTSIGKLIQSAVLICIDCKIKPKKLSKTAHIIYSKTAYHDIDSFVGIYNLGNNKTVRLYKSVKEDFTDFYSGKIKYEGIVTCHDFDPNTERECGGGLHLSPTPELARRFNDGKILECEVDVKDIVIYKHDIKKVRCKKVKVLGKWKEVK